MVKAKTSSFITEVPLVVDSFLERKLEARFQAARQLYNACLNEALRRLERVRKSRPYLTAKALSRTKKKERRELFKQARDDAQFSEYSFHSFATVTALASKWIAKNVDSNTQQRLASRAFQAAEKILFGVSTKVRFKVSSRFRSVEGKSNKQGLRWKEEQVQWCGLTLEPIIDWNNPVVVHGLHSKVKYCRLLWRNLNGKKRWFVQLINEGLPYQKPQNYVTKGVVGLDVNISNVAFVADEQAGLLPFAEKVPTYEREIKVLQRKMQRSMRSNNPDNFEPDFDKKVGNHIVRKKGKVLKGRRPWIRSKNYRKLARQLAELQRRKASYAKCHNRRLVNEILRHGNEVKTEKVSIKGWQRRYGKAIAAKSPGFFQSEIKRKAENAGGCFLQFSTQTTALSQTHLDGTRIKKSLSERIHQDVTGVTMHRDLFSAFLSRYVYGDQLSLQDALREYPRAEPLLVDAWKQYQQTARQVGTSKRKNYHSSSEQLSTQVLTSNQITTTAVKS